jgi:hypothetical protein
MISPILSQTKLSSSQISVAAEAFAAAQFALSGFDVLEQAGRSRHVFDLAVARSGGMLRLSVHASFNGFWDLVDRYLNTSKRADATIADYHRAIKTWFEHQSSRVTCCLVQFEPADLHRMPRLYLASPAEVAMRLHEKIDRLSTEELDTSGIDMVHRLEGMPQSWRFSQTRIAELMELPAGETGFAPQYAERTECKECSKPRQAACTQYMPIMN